MKILHILDHSQPIISGYSSRSYYILKWQKKIGLKPVAITSPLYNRNQKTWEEIEGIKYYRTYLPAIFLQYPGCRELTTILALKQKIESIYQLEKSDIIHAHSPSLCGLAASLVAKKLKKPFVYEIRAFWEDAAIDQGKFTYGSYFYKIYQKLENEVVKRANAVITLCQGLRKELISRGFKPEKIFVVPNAVDLNRFTPLSRDNQLAQKLGVNNNIVLGFIGSFYRFEGLDLLVKAVAKIEKVKLILVGDGEKYEELKKLVSELNLSSKVILTGRILHNEVKKYYSLMDIMVYPRLSEKITELVTPLKPLEAMALGKIVIGSDVGGIKEIIGEGENSGGVLFKAGSVDSLIDRLKLIISNPDLRSKLRKKAYQRARERNWSKVIHNYLRIYATIR